MKELREVLETLLTRLIVEYERKYWIVGETFT